MANNKIIFGNEVLLDLTQDTITAADLANGVTAHDKSGAQITGTNTYDAESKFSQCYSYFGIQNIIKQISGSNTDVYFTTTPFAKMQTVTDIYGSTTSEIIHLTKF